MQANISSGIEERIQAFVKLGDLFRAYVQIAGDKDSLGSSDENWISRLDEAVGQAGITNGWFTFENVIYALDGWGELLLEDRLRTWLSAYSLKQKQSKTVAIIAAGNIPLVGFHDVLSTLITGNKALIKCSSNDKVLLPFIANFLIECAPLFKEHIEFRDGMLKDFDLVIATGSNNTARYFEYYFGKKPHIIRRNRNSVAVLSAAESLKDLELLGEDIFRYFGLGCRSVSKLYVPKDYDFDLLYKALFSFKAVLDHDKYTNNYDYNKAVYLMSEFKILDNGFLMLKEELQYASPIATLFFEYYTSDEALKRRLENDQDRIQCLVANGFMKGEIPFGQTQRPELNDYADGVDTVEFLLRNS